MIFAAVLAVVVATQAQLLAPQSDIWNSTYNISSTQARGTNLTDAELEAISIALNFERSNWAGGSIAEDAFYTMPPDASNATAGSVIKIQSFVNTSIYNLPPNTALSRIIYMTEDVNGRPIPASAYILWPWMPLTQPDGTYPLISWGHGTSGAFSECAPSHYRNLQYQYSAPYTLTLSGYVVVAPDYAGLGINETADGLPIYHPYLYGQAQGADLLYAAQAARVAFPNISQNFIVMGHSQGGGAAWGAAIRQRQLAISGYLGTVSAAPSTNLTAQAALVAGDGDAAAPATGSFLLAHSLQALHNNFNLSSLLTDQGIARWKLAHDLGMCTASLPFLLGTSSSLIQTTAGTSPELAAYIKMIDIGSQDISGPMLVLHGTGDQYVPEPVTTAAVASACRLHPDAGIEYWRFTNVTHIPILFASQRLWLEWIAKRFAHAAKNGTLTASSGGETGGMPCSEKNFTSLPFQSENYQSELGYFLELVTKEYQVRAVQ